MDDAGESDFVNGGPPFLDMASNLHHATIEDRVLPDMREQRRTQELALRASWSSATHLRNRRISPSKARKGGDKD